MTYLNNLSQLNSVENLNLLEFNPRTSNQNPKGGFWDRPFGSENSWWSVGGGMRTWECGDALTSFDGAKYTTNHTIFFRGQPPPRDLIIQRYLQKLKKDN